MMDGYAFLKSDIRHHVRGTTGTHTDINAGKCNKVLDSGGSGGHSRTTESWGRKGTMVQSFLASAL